jgi:hypothetical protein
LYPADFSKRWAIQSRAALHEDSGGSVERQGRHLSREPR